MAQTASADIASEIDRAHDEARRSRCLRSEAQRASVEAKRLIGVVETRRRERLVVRRVDLAGGMRFTLHGAIDGERVHASYRQGRLVVDGPLWRAAQTIVGLDEVFVHPETGATITAALGDDFVRTALTLIRAVDRIDYSDVMLAPPIPAAR